MGILGYSCSVDQPLHPQHSSFRVALLASAWLVALSSHSFAQPTPPESTKASAIKLPDGTIVFWTKNPDEANPIVEGVVLSPQDYKALVEQAEQARKAKSQTPSSVAIRAKIELRGERLIAALNLTYSFRVAQPRTILVLGCQRGVLVAAKTGAGKLPIFYPPGDEGLTLFVESAGEQTVTLDVEVPVVVRGLKGELGFDLGLPRAAITTFKLDGFPAGIKSVSLGTRVAESPAVPLKLPELKRFASAVEPLLAKAVPLGATDTIDVAWDPPTPTTPNAAALPVVESDVVVRVENAQIESVAKLRLRGNLKEWPLQFPVGTDVVVERVNPPGVTAPETAPATVVRPTDPNKPVWLIRTPGGTVAEWLVTATVRVTRPKPGDPKFRGPYLVGPFAPLVGAKQSGRIGVFAGPTVRLSFKYPSEIRRQDLPAMAADDHIASFVHDALAVPPPNAKAAPWLEIDARVAPTAIRAKASHQLKLTPGGWKLESTVRIVPPPRGEVEQIVVEMPAEWPTLEAAPEEIVEGIQIVKEGSPRLLSIRFVAPQKSAFALRLLSTRALPPKPASDDRESKLSLALPRFPQADERESSVLVSVPEGFEVRGGVALWEGGLPSAAIDPLNASAAPPNRPGAVGSVAGTFERGIARVDVGWQPYRPPLACENRVDVTLQSRQVLVQQVLKFKPSQDDRRPIRLRGSEGVLGLQSVPALETVGPGLWEFRPAEPGKEFSLTVAFALRMVGPAVDPAVYLLWPESATRTDSVLRVWGGATGRRVNGFAGDWRDLPPEPVPGRDALPVLTLAASTAAAPLTLDLGPVGDTGLPTVWIERAYLRATVSESSVVLHEKLLLKRWLGSSLEIELPRCESVEVSVEGKRIEALPAAADDSETVLLTVPLPESKPGRTVDIEVRYRHAAARSPRRERLLKPPAIRGALYRTPLRWSVATDPDTVALFPSGQWESDFRWVWRGTGFTPTASASTRELDAWLRDGTESDADDLSPALTTGGETTGGTQSAPDAIPILLVPRAAWIAACSTLLFLVGLIVARLRRSRLAPVLAVLGIGLVVAGATSPQTLAQALSAMQAGAVLLTLTLFARAGWRTYMARRLERLPGFTRDRQVTAVPAAFQPSNAESGKSPSPPTSPSANVPRSGSGSAAIPISSGARP